MMDNAKWEVVSYGKKKPQGQKLSKSQKKKMAESMPTINKNDYHAKMRSGYVGDDGSGSDNDSDGFSPVDIKLKKPSSPGKQAKKPAQVKPKTVRPPTLKEVLNNLDVTDLRNDYAVTSQAFPDKPLIWLTDLAAAIERKIPIGTQGLDREWYNPTNDDKSFPLSALNVNAVKYLTSIVENQSPNVLGSYIASCCQQMMLLVSRGASTNTIGIRIMLQLINKRSPRFLLINTADLIKLTGESTKNSAQFFTLYWCFTQAGRANFDVGMRVLLDLLFPHINVKAFGNAIVSFAEELISARHNCDTIGYRDFFPLLDVMHASVYDEKSIPTNIAPNLMKRLQALYPRTKALGLLSRNGDELKQFFPSLLYRLRPKGGGKLTEELLLCLVHCLINSPQCFVVWKHMHLKHVSQSNVLLCHLVKQWGWLQKRLNRRATRDLLSFLAKQHAKDEVKTDGYFIAINAKLLIGSSTPSFMERIMRLTFIFFTFAIILLTVDVYTRGSYKSSRTRQFFDTHGLAKPMEDRFDAVVVAAGPWMSVAGKKLCCIRHSVEPYVITAWNYVRWLVNAIYQFLQPYCLLLWLKMEPYVIEMEKQWPHLVEVVSVYLQMFGECLIKAFWKLFGVLEIVWNYILQFDWSPVIAFGNSCYSTASYYVQQVYSSSST